jgi:hypothetical protein
MIPVGSRVNYELDVLGTIEIRRGRVKDIIKKDDKFNYIIIDELSQSVFEIAQEKVQKCNCC